MLKSFKMIFHKYTSSEHNLVSLQKKTRGEKWEYPEQMDHIDGIEWRI